MVALILSLGIGSIVVGFLGGILFGIFGALIGLCLGIAALVLAIHAIKTGNNGTAVKAGFVCSIVGTVLSVIFFMSCGICGLTNSDCLGGYACYGCVGGSCKASCDINNAAKGAVKDFYNMFGY